MLFWPISGFLTVAASDAAPYFHGIVLPDADTLKTSLERTRLLEEEYLQRKNHVSMNLTLSTEVTGGCKQACSSWCWATCATMTLQDLGGASGSCTDIEQEIVQMEISKSCDTSCPSGKCDVGGSGVDIADAINDVYGGGMYSYTNHALSQDELDQALQDGPVTALVNCPGYGGHAIYIREGSDDDYSGYDPEGYSIRGGYSGITSYNPSYLPSARCSWFGTTAILDSKSDQVDQPYFHGIVLPDAETLKTSLERTRLLEEEYLKRKTHVSMNFTLSTEFAGGCKQACPSWCWATCATMTLQDLGGASGSCTDIEQEIVQMEISKSCDTSCPSGKCDVGGSGVDIADAINDVYGGGMYSYTNHALSQDELDQALQDGPVTALVNCPGYGGHAIYIREGSDDEYSGYDPEGYGINGGYSSITSYNPSYLPSARCSWFGTTAILDSSKSRVAV